MSFVSLSLKARLALITTALAAVLGTGIVLASLHYAHNDLRAALQDQQDSIVKLAASQLDTAMEDRITLLSHLAPQLADQLTLPTPALRRLLDSRIPIPGTFNSYIIADAQGRMLGQPGVPVSIADRDYFREAARTLEPVVSAPIRARTNGTTGVLVTVQILSAQGEFRGLLGGWLNLASANFLVEITHNRLGTTGFYCLVSSGRAPVYVRHPDPARAMQPARALGDTCGADNRNGRIEFLWPERPLIARYLMESTGWELVAVLPAQEAFEPLHAMQARFLCLALLALAGVALMIWLTVRHLLAPLTRLRQVVRESAHDLAAYERLPAQQHDEIGDLARAFGQLMRDLRERREQLDLSERQLRAVTDTLPALLGFIDTEERYLFNNAAYERTFGIPLDKLRGMTVREVVGETRYTRARPFLQKALAGTAVTFEVEDSDPEYRCMETSLRPEWNADGSQVIGVHVHVQDVTQRKLETMRLSRISRLDHLTQLLNRSAFESLLQAAMTRSREGGRLMALLYLDMDRFKAVNDFHGHITGDLLLQAFGRRLQRCVRERDAVARLGGDEFAVVLEDIGAAANARRIANAIVMSVSRRFFIDGVFADVDVSIGVALYQGAPMPDQELMRQADTLLYRAKAAGRGRFEIGPPELLPQDAGGAWPQDTPDL
ncbi:sensor domain-containing diguanylate cyclase [Cupriavidus basilensis]|uniref:sensor domain-containing diguanylate cyclase n=1 Tax=Cupriavidus basilensis TaxID=68895 RepID=UPI000750DE72|nr:diguanylate cyclase [Cupriavidus basilensis]